MADLLHSPAENSHSCSTYPAWDLHSLALFNADISLAMENMISTPPYFSTIGCDSYLLSGYLEDVLVDYGNPSKRRRLLYTTDHEQVLDWPSLQSHVNLTDNNGLSTWVSGDEEKILQDAKMVSFGETTESTGMVIQRKKTKRRSGLLKRLVYPFALVKPGWEEGDVTLNDINESMLMPPLRPIRHPVGDFACVSRPHGHGLSGKAVVALTRIRTLGRGTVTIIRTRG